MLDIKPSIYYTRVQLFLLSFIAATMPWSTKLCNLGILFLVVFWLFFITKKPIANVDKFIVLSSISYFAVLTLSLLSANVTDHALKMYETRLPFLFVPLFFFLRKDRIPLSHILISLFMFVVSVLFLTFLLFKNGFDFLDSENRIWALQEIMVLHRPYLGVYISFSIIATLTIVMHRKLSVYPIILSVILIFYFIFILYAIIAKNAIIGIALAGYLSVCIFLWTKGKRIFVTVILLLSLATASYQYLFNQKIRTFVEMISSFSYLSYEDYHTNLIDSFNRRFEIWDCAIEVLKNNETWLKGVGLGNEQMTIDKCYLNKGYLHMGDGNFNAHNQILQDTITAGILLGIFSILLFVTPFLIALKQGNYSLLATVIVMFTFSLSESVFLRQKGVVFFVLFVCLLTHLSSANIISKHESLK